MKEWGISRPTIPPRKNRCSNTNEVVYFLIRVLCQPTEVLRTDHPVACSTNAAG